MHLLSITTSARERVPGSRASLPLPAGYIVRALYGRHVVEIPILIPEESNVGDSKQQPDPNFRDPRRIFRTSKVATSEGRDVLNLAQDFRCAPVSLVEMMILALAGTRMLPPRSPRIHCVQFPSSVKGGADSESQGLLQGPAFFFLI